MQYKFIVLALALASCTFILIGLADKHLPYSDTKVHLIDALTIPGGALAGIFYPQGVHTGSGSAAQFVYLVLIGNFCFYFVIWYGLIRSAARAFQLRYR